MKRNKAKELGAEYLRKFDAAKKKKQLEAQGRKKDRVKTIKPKKLEYLKSCELPATQKQIDYIEVLVKRSTRKYDYNFERDKYTLSIGVAVKFIEALLAGEDFKVCKHKLCQPTVAPVKVIPPMVVELNECLTDKEKLEWFKRMMVEDKERLNMFRRMMVEDEYQKEYQCYDVDEQ